MIAYDSVGVVCRDFFYMCEGFLLLNLQGTLLNKYRINIIILFFLYLK